MKNKLLTAQDFKLEVLPVHVERIKKVCEYIEKNVTDDQFDLAVFKELDYHDYYIGRRHTENPILWMAEAEPSLIEHSANPECGAIGCFIGHGFDAFKGKEKNALRSCKEWEHVSQYLSGLNFPTMTGATTTQAGLAWGYLFRPSDGIINNDDDETLSKMGYCMYDEDISEHHDTRLGTIKRVRHFYGIPHEEL